MNVFGIKLFTTGAPSKEQSSGAASEEVIHREASMYDKLLMSL